MDLGEEAEVLAPGQQLVKRQRLRSEADAGAVFRPARGAAPGDRDLARVGSQQSGADRHRGRLAGAVGAEQAEDLAVADRKRQRVDRDAGAVPLADLLDPEHGL